MNRVQVRTATAGDRGRILRLLHEASLSTEDLGDWRVEFWVAESDGQALGTVGLERYGESGLLRSLVVAPASRQQGLGTVLVEAAERGARSAGVRELYLLTQTAERFFESRDYRIVDRDRAPELVRASTEFRSLCPVSATCMAKSLQAQTHATPRAAAPLRVLFLCTGNSCRSILGEATFNHLAPAGWRAMSAGSRSTGTVHPRSLALLAREGIPTAGCCSKSWDDLPQTPDIVITVCASAAGEACPAYLGPVLRTHWGVDDPAHATGTDAEIDAAFVAAYRTLRRRIEAFLALPLADLRADPERLKIELDRIGTQVS